MAVTYEMQKLGLLMTSLAALGMSIKAPGSCDWDRVAGPSLERRVRAGWVHLPEPYREQLDHTYAYWSWQTFQRDPRVRGRTLAQELGYRYLEGDQHARSLVRRFGFQFSEQGGPHLIPPASYQDLSIAYARALDDGGQGQSLEHEGTLHPALAFSGVRGPNTGIVQFVVPGIDPWPSPEDWRLELGSGQFPSEVWYGAIEQGRLPITIERLLEHELGHMTDYAENPILVKQSRCYAGGFRGKSVGVLALQRSDILNEWLSLPNSREAARIRAELPELFLATGADPVAREIARLDDLLADDPAALERRYQMLSSSFERLTERHGGGLRDGRSMSHFSGLSRVLYEIEDRLGAKPMSGSDDIRASRESLEGMMIELRVLHELRRQLDRGEQDLGSFAKDLVRDFDSRGELLQSYPHEVDAYVRRLLQIGPSPSKKLDDLILDRMARIEVALSEWVKLDLNLSTFILETRTHPPPPGSKSYRYLRSYLSPNSFSAKAFGIEGDGP